MGRSRKWTEDEINFLEDKWGQMTIPGIAKKLNRSVYSIKNKAQRIGLTRHIHSGEYVTFNLFMNAIGRPYGASYTKQQWIDKGLPVMYKKSINKRYAVIYIDDFWKWADKHRTLIDFSKMEKNILGAEPEWVKEQRKADIRATQQFKKTPWTSIEDAKLTRMVKAYKYNYRDISLELRRTEGAIKRRLCTLGLKERPLKAYNHNKWTNEEVEILRDLYSKGYIAELIADHLPGRSALAIKGKLENMLKSGELISRCNKKCS